MPRDHIPYDKRKGVAMSDLVGLTFVSVTKSEDEIEFKTADGRTFLMCHVQDCCEYVTIEDIVGDIDDLIGEPILLAEEVTGEPAQRPGWAPEYMPESYTWTFYKLATRKGYVDIRWLGESNGYYSESVDLIEVLP